jgi:hypothetical protein
LEGVSLTQEVSLVLEVYTTRRGIVSLSTSWTTMTPPPPKKEEKEEEKEEEKVEYTIYKKILLIIRQAFKLVKTWQ